MDGKIVTALEALAYIVAYLFHAAYPYLFFPVWIFLIVVGALIAKKEPITVKNVWYAVLVGTPLGVLSAYAASENFGVPDNTAALIGCFVAIMAEKILNGQLLQKIIDAALQKWTKS